MTLQQTSTQSFSQPFNQDNRLRYEQISLKAFSEKLPIGNTDRDLLQRDHIFDGIDKDGAGKLDLTGLQKLIHYFEVHVKGLLLGINQAFAANHSLTHEDFVEKQDM